MKLASVTGALASATLWAFDFLRLPRYELVQEAKLCGVHLMLGGLLGCLVALSFRDKLPPLRLAVVSAGLTLSLGVLALLAMVGTYPQLFADRWWLRGGLLGTMQVLVTHTIGPRLFDLLCIALLAAGVLNPLARALRHRRRRFATLALVTLFAIVAATSLTTRANVTNIPHNVLIVLSDSLRADALEDEATMPYTAARIPQGSLYRYAVTPVARTYPAMVSMLTGTEPRTHGVRHTFTSATGRRDLPTLITELRDSGYFTFLASDSEDTIVSGVEARAAPDRDIASLHRGSTLHRHRFSLTLLRFRWFRSIFPEWRNVPFLADPEWVVDDALSLLESADERPFAGLVFFATAQGPYLAPYPYYNRSDTTYRGRYLYHHSPLTPPAPPTEEDIEQLEDRYRGALSAVDRATERLLSAVDDTTLVIVTGMHGETPGIETPGDTVRSDAQTVPLLLLGAGVPPGVRSDEQVRLLDLPATALDLLGTANTFGDGTTLLDVGTSRPACVETGLWLAPDDGADRLDYPGVSELVTTDPSFGEIVLRRDMDEIVENAKERGLILGNRLYREQPTRNGLERDTSVLDGLAPASDHADLATLFEARCVEGDDNLSRLYGTLVYHGAAR